MHLLRSSIRSVARKGMCAYPHLLLVSLFTIAFNSGLSEEERVNNSIPLNELIDDTLTVIGEPYFVVTASKNVTSLVGRTAQLNCRVRNAGNRTVSWIRHRDLHLLTSGVMTYTSDQRFVAFHNARTEDFILKIRFAQRRDSGIYECQVGTTPPMGHLIKLTIVEPITTIEGGPELFINKGSTINLTCVVKHAPEPPHITWIRDGQEISYDSPRGGVSVITERGTTSASSLLVQRARSTDSGLYSCVPRGADPASARVHVLNGEYPAAMQNSLALRFRATNVLVHCSVYTLLVFLIRKCC